MTIELSLAAKNARLAGLLALMDEGPGVCTVSIYGSVQPLVHAEPGAAPLVQLPLLKPSGVISNGQMVLQSGLPTQNLLTGAAVWARISSGAGQTILDGSVSLPTGPGDIKLTSSNPSDPNSLIIYIGGETVLASGSFG